MGRRSCKTGRFEVPGSGHLRRPAARRLIRPRGRARHIPPVPRPDASADESPDASGSAAPGAVPGVGSGAGASPEPIAVLINTQTPLLQFAASTDGIPADWKFESDLSKLDEGTDYRLSPGGVTRMIFPLARRLIATGVWRDVHWVSLNPNAPETVQYGGITLHNIAIDHDRMGGYGKTKEEMWSTIHGLQEPRLSSDLFWTEDYSEYAFYNRTTAELITKLDREHDFDAFYIHDFQQLPVGQMLGTIKPKLFHWHIPFDARAIPDLWKPLMSTYLDSYDAIIVSSDRYLAALNGFGHAGRVERLYPFLDPQEYHRPTPEAAARTVAKFGLLPADTVALVVARMDPSKGQDRAIASVARLAERFPHLRLVLAGNGSFSSSQAGLGLSKGERWRAHLEEVARELGVYDRVVFTGHVTQEELDALYARCAFTILPSVFEGFGLVVVESWLHRRAALVTTRAGVADLVREGENGLLFDPDDPKSFDRQMAKLLSNAGGIRAHIGARGARSARDCTLDGAMGKVVRLFRDVVGS
jgi:glycosyltransferase involved in cell wall biosynthesis